jgi:transglutaminase-like putative cysteine protease
MKSEHSKNLSLVVIVLFFIGFAYITVKAIQISNKTRISTDAGIYSNKVSTSKEIASKAQELSKNCKNDLCKVQSILDYVTHIPYKINHFRANSPQKTIQNNFGDCDDKSNLLISMLHSLDKEAYFVLVPKHIFVISPIEDTKLDNRKGLLIDGKKYFIPI